MPFIRKNGIGKNVIFYADNPNVGANLVFALLNLFSFLTLCPTPYPLLAKPDSAIAAVADRINMMMVGAAQRSHSRV
jgi:hypothetical protein